MSESPNPPPSALLPNPSSSALLGTTSPHTEFLPPIPGLTGIYNVEEWKYAVRLYLNHHGLLEFIDGTHQNGQANIDVETPGSWLRRRAHAFTILNTKIGFVMPELLTAGLKAYDDDYDFNPQELWNYITHYIRIGTRSDSLKDRMLLHLFNHRYRYEGVSKEVFIKMRRRLRTCGVQVHPEVMRHVGVTEDDLHDEDRIHFHSMASQQIQGRWLTYEAQMWNVSVAFDEEDFQNMLEEVEDHIVA
ncbi:hypothetical protein N0V85_005220 [Neurospora sp. IMI 360204]|nr:hypothetical protein N0V85_005220 [Neurospora sp. IMI 360204]